MEINWLAVVAAAVSSFVIGGLWYGPIFGKAWMRASGIGTEQAAEARMGMVFGLSFFLQLVAAVVLILFLGTDKSSGFMVMASASVGLFWVAPSLGVVYLFEQRSFRHWLVNAGYLAVSFTVMGIILAFWR